MLPCASSIEKEGSISNSGRWMQWRYKAVESRGDFASRRRHHGRALLQAEGPLREGGRPQQGGHHEALVELRQVRQQGALPPRRPRHRQGDQRNLPGRQGRREPRHEGEDALQERPAGSQLRLPAGRRLDLLGRLGLLRILHRRGQHVGTARKGRPHGSGTLPPVGLVLAGQSPDHLQRRLGASRDGQALEPGTGPSSSGTARSGRATCPTAWAIPAAAAAPSS